MTAELHGVDLLLVAIDEVFPVAHKHPEFTVPQPVPVEQRDDKYQRAAHNWCTKHLDGRAGDLGAMAPNTGRNHALNKAAYTAFRYVLAGHLDGHHCVEVLKDAALECGLGNGEIEATLGSAQRGAQRDGPAEPPVTGSPVTRDPFDGLEVDPVTGEVLPPLEVRMEDLSAEQRSALIRKNLPTIDWHALWADESEEEWIVEPILPARRLIALYSAPKVGKSLLLLELCCAIATGRDVLGVSIDRPRAVLYVDFENDPKADVRERLQAMGYGPDDLTNLHYLSFPTLGALDSERGGHELMAAIEEYECEVCVIDTVSRAIEGEENENDTWLAFYRHTGLRMKQAGVALIRLDHAGKDETKGQRGGSAKSGDVDAVWRLSRVNDTTYKLDCEAARMPILEKTLVLHREVMPLRHRVDGLGRAAVNDIQVADHLEMLKRADVPLDLGRDKARAWLKDKGFKASNGPLSQAIQKRRNLSVDRSAGEEL